MISESVNIYKKLSNPKIISKDLRKEILKDHKKINFIKVDRPTLLGSARSKGYKNNKNMLIIRTRISKGTNKYCPSFRGRTRFLRTQTRDVSHQLMAERRVQRKYTNLHVLNSYFIVDNKYFQIFEVILAPFNDQTLQEGEKVSLKRNKVFRQ